MTTTIVIAGLIILYLVIAVALLLMLWPSKDRGEEVSFVLFASATWLLLLFAFAIYAIFDRVRTRLAK